MSIIGKHQFTAVGLLEKLVARELEDEGRRDEEDLRRKGGREMSAEGGGAN